MDIKWTFEVDFGHYDLILAHFWTFGGHFEAILDIMT